MRCHLTLVLFWLGLMLNLRGKESWCDQTSCYCVVHGTRTIGVKLFDNGGVIFIIFFFPGHSIILNAPCVPFLIRSKTGFIGNRESLSICIDFRKLGFNLIKKKKEKKRTKWNVTRYWRKIKNVTLSTSC